MIPSDKISETTSASIVVTQEPQIRTDLVLVVKQYPPHCQIICFIFHFKIFTVYAGCAVSQFIAKKLKKHLRLARKEYTYIMKAAYVLLSRENQLLKTISLSSNTISDLVIDLARDTYSVSLNKNMKYEIVVSLDKSSDLNYILLEETLQNV